MAKTINQLVSDFQTLTNDSSTSSGTLAKTLINFGVKSILSTQDWTFNKDYDEQASGTSVQAYNRPYNAQKIDSVHYWHSNTWHALKNISSNDYWRELNSTVIEGLPSLFHINEQTGQIELLPISSDSKGTIQTRYTKKVRDLGVANYATGSIAVYSSGTIDSNGTTITLSLNDVLGAGTSFGTVLQGRSISVSGTNTPADDFWLEIKTVSNGTTLITKEDFPNSFGTISYTVAELIPLPDGYEDIPLWYALDRYYQIKEKPALAREYERKYKEQLNELMYRDSVVTNRIITQEGGEGFTNPNENSWSIHLS